MFGKNKKSLDVPVTIGISEEDHKMLTEVAEKHGFTLEEYTSMLVNKIIEDNREALKNA